MQNENNFWATNGFLGLAPPASTKGFTYNTTNYTDSQVYSYIWNEYLTCGINEPVVTIKIKRGYSELIVGNDGQMGNNANFNNGNCNG